MPTNFEAIGVVFIVKSVVMRGQEKQEEEEQKYAGLGTSLEHMTSRNSLLLASVARWLVCHWGGKYTDCRPPPRTHTHTHKHTCYLSVKISYLVTGADAGFWRGGGGFDMAN